MKRAISVISLLLILGSAALQAQSTGLLRQPAISADQLAFVYAGDIWIARRDGLQPRRLTSSPAPESMLSLLKTKSLTR